MTKISSRFGSTAAVLIALVQTTALGAAALALAATASQKHFPSPDDAAKALIEALRTDDTKALVAILGAGSKPLIDSGDPVADQTAYDAVVKSYDEGHSWENTSETTAVLQTGKDNWPMPIPLVKEKDGWRFDTAAGADEVINRRIGRNELSAIQACRAYVDAQNEYYLRNPDSNPLLHYADKFDSSKGKRDGLYWETTEGEPESPLGPFFAEARGAGYALAAGKPAPYHGYYYRILKAQGAHAAGGAYDYVAHGVMLGGFALVAYPATYDVSGVMTFLVNHAGVVFEKDLGPKTARLAGAMKAFDPDSTWKAVPND